MREMVTFIIILSILAVASFAILCFAGGAKWQWLKRNAHVKAR
jgi:DMSO/TMAO reductase YedYZ heme-binding membrane subunit